MIDFVGRSRSPLDDMQQWNQYFQQDAARAQQDWQNREIRNRYDEAARYNRDGAISDTQFYGNAGAGITSDTQGMNTQAAGLHVEDIPQARVATATTASTTPGTSTPATPSATPIMGPHSGRPLQSRSTLAAQVPAEGMYSLGSITPQLWAQLQSARQQGLITIDDNQINRGVINVRRTNTSPTPNSAPFAAGGSSEYNNPNRTQPGAPRATATIPPPLDPTAAPGTATTANAGDPASLYDDPNAEAHVGGLEPPDSYQGTHDTSRGLQPTREMRMIETQIQDSLRRSDIAARHGDRAGAQAAFAQALQGQAAYMTQHRTQLYHSAAAGSMDALSTLIADFNGYPPGTVRFQPTDERRTRFVMQVQRNNGEWVSASETPHTREELLSGVENLIDAEGAHARTEAATELMRARVAAGAQITVATIEQQTAIRRMITDAMIAQWNNQARAELAAGHGDFQVDQDGGVWFTYPMADANGHMTIQREHLQMQDIPTPGVDGGRTSRQPTATRVVGIPGITPSNGANH